MSKLSTLFAPAFLLLLAAFFLPISCEKLEQTPIPPAMYRNNNSGGGINGPFTNPPLSPLIFKITRTSDGKPVPNATIILWKKTDLYGPSQLVETLGKTNSFGVLVQNLGKDSLPSQHYFSCSADGYNGIVLSINNPLDKKFTGNMSQLAQVTIHATFTDTIPQKCLCYHSYIHQPNPHAPPGNAQAILLWTGEQVQLDTTISFSIPLSKWLNEVVCYKFDPSYQVNSSLFFPNDQNKRSFKFPAPTIDSTFVIDFKW